MESGRKIRHRADLFAHRVKRYCYLSLVVVLPVGAVALAVAVEVTLLRHGDRLLDTGGVPPWLVGPVTATVGGLDPLVRTIVLGVGFLCVMVGMATLVLRST